MNSGNKVGDENTPDSFKSSETHRLITNAGDAGEEIETSSKKDGQLVLANINFPDDSTINDFFKICKSLIKGGFNDDKLKTNNIKNLNFNNAENYTKLVKYNNYIIQDNLILNSFTNKAASIFTYVDKSQTPQNMNMYKDYDNYSINSNNISLSSDVNNNKLNFVRMATNTNVVTQTGSDKDNDSHNHSSTQIKENNNLKLKNRKLLKMFDSESYEPEGYYSVKGILFMPEVKEVIQVVKIYKRKLQDEDPNLRDVSSLLNEMYNNYTNKGEDLRRSVFDNK
jgi:hypothetical protein